MPEPENPRQTFPSLPGFSFIQGGHDSPLLVIAGPAQPYDADGLPFRQDAEDRRALDSPPPAVAAIDQRFPMNTSGRTNGAPSPIRTRPFLPLVHQDALTENGKPVETETERRRSNATMSQGSRSEAMGLDPALHRTATQQGPSTLQAAGLAALSWLAFSPCLPWSAGR